MRIETDRHPASHPCYRDSLGTLCNSDVLTTESECFTAYATVWLQYHLISSSRPQLLPENTKPATRKSDATPVCTTRRSSQAQSDYGTEYLQIPVTSHLTASSWSCQSHLITHHVFISPHCTILFPEVSTAYDSSAYDQHAQHDITLQ